MLNAEGKKYRIYFLEILLDEDPYMSCLLSHRVMVVGFAKKGSHFILGRPKAGLPEFFLRPCWWERWHSQNFRSNFGFMAGIEPVIFISTQKKSGGNCVAIFPLAMLTTDADAVLPLVLHDCERRSFWTLPLHLNISSSIGVQNCGCEVRMRRVHKKELKILSLNHVEPYPVL